MTHHICKTCGGSLINENGAWVCKYCGNVYEDDSVKKEEEMLRSLLDEYKTEQVANLRRTLYDAINAKYIDSEEICRLCVEIKKLLPDDFMATFYYTANHGTPKEVCSAIRGTDADEHSVYVEGIVRHVARSLRSEYTLPLQNLVERCFKNTDISKYEELSTIISEEADKVNAGIYETSVPRDVFVAYSSKDMQKVEELVEELEENGLDCFVAIRNLRHGRGAVQNYEKALHEAMDNCRCVVFLSSVNSRTMECDALKVELKYIKTQDILNAPAEYRNNYAAMPSQYKKHRIEYRIDNERSQPIAQRILTEFFSGLEYAYSPGEIVTRIYDFDDELAMTEQRKKEEAAKAEAEMKAAIEAAVAEMKASTAAATAATVPTPASNAEQLLKRARMALEDGEFDRADDFCEQILNQDPECADAYLCKLLAELRVSKKELLKEQKELFDNNNNYKKVIRFGTPETKVFLNNCISVIKDRLERERRAREAEERRPLERVTTPTIGSPGIGEQHLANE